MVEKAVFNESFMLKYCVDRYKTQKMCGKVVDDFLSALKFVADWLVTRKMIEKLHSTLFAEDDIFFFDSGNTTFSSDEMGIF